MTSIIIGYTSVDGARARKTFKTLAAARAYATKMVGANPDTCGSYAVSDDGVGKIIVVGVTLAALFADPSLPPPPAAPVDGDFGVKSWGEYDVPSYCGNYTGIGVSSSVEAYADPRAAVAYVESYEDDGGYHPEVVRLVDGLWVSAPAFGPEPDHCRCSHDQLAHVGCDCGFVEEGRSRPLPARSCAFDDMPF